VIARPSGRCGGCAFKVRGSVPPPIRRLRLGRAILDAAAALVAFGACAFFVMFVL
jgi:hypothetical protein